MIDRKEFLKLSVDERREVLREQADALLAAVDYKSLWEREADKRCDQSAAGAVPLLMSFNAKSGLEVIADYWCLLRGDPATTTPVSVWPNIDAAVKEGEDIFTQKVIEAGQIRVMRLADWLSVYRP